MLGLRLGVNARAIVGIRIQGLGFRVSVRIRVRVFGLGFKLALELGDGF